MQHSEFWSLLRAEFGSGYAAVLASMLHLPGVGGRTAEEALAEGEEPGRVWAAVCDAMDVPPERRFGPDLPLRRDPGE